MSGLERAAVAIAKKGQCTMEVGAHARGILNESMSGLHRLLAIAVPTAANDAGSPTDRCAGGAAALPPVWGDGAGSANPAFAPIAPPAARPGNRWRPGEATKT